MPLDTRDSPDAFKANIAELIKSGRKRAQAVAIAYRVLRENRAKKRPA